MSGNPTSTIDLNQRAGLLLKLLVERYIADGQPVGSKTLADSPELKVSSATVRNVLADLEAAGLVRAPHTSAGRVPTDRGLRYFIDELLTPEPLRGSALQLLRRQLMSQLDFSAESAERASQMLSSMTRLTAVVTIPQHNHARLRQIEFLPLARRRVLAILVVNEHDVQNRVLELDHDVSPADLVAAANEFNRRFGGRDLAAIHRQLRREISSNREQVNTMLRRAADLVSDAAQQRKDVVIAGGSNLLGFQDAFDVERLRGLFEAFDRKRDLLDLVEHCMHAQGIQIFVGRESGYDVLDSCSVVTAPYEVDGEVAGVLGVIGPTRMAYSRVIPMVDAAAAAFSAALKKRS